MRLEAVTYEDVTESCVSVSAFCIDIGGHARGEGVT
jgi:hypothetical protein